jgi:hypothetical protein
MFCVTQSAVRIPPITHSPSHVSEVGVDKRGEVVDLQEVCVPSAGFARTFLDVAGTVCPAWLRLCDEENNGVLCGNHITRR